MITTHLILLFLNAGSGSGSLVDHFSATLDMNTAILLYLNDYYSTSYRDINAPLQRYLKEATASDSTNQWKKL